MSDSAGGSRAALGGVSVREPHLSDQRTTAMGLGRFAFEYIDAAMVVERNDQTPTHISPTPAYFLAMHGIELTLKAFLRHNGVSVRELRDKKLGHDLHACHRKAKELGLKAVFNEQPGDTDALHMLIALNRNQGLRYIETGYKRFPMWSIVEPLAVCLRQAVAKQVGFRTFEIAYPGRQQ